MVPLHMGLVMDSSDVLAEWERRRSVVTGGAGAGSADAASDSWTPPPIVVYQCGGRIDQGTGGRKQWMR